MTSTIRPYQTSDFPDLLSMMQAHIPTFFAAEELAEYQAYLANEREDYFVFEEQGRILAGGGINYFPDERTARISWDVVHPDHMGKGIGAQLTRHRIEHIRRQKAFDQIIVRTSQLVYPFYERQGFKLFFTERDFWAPGFDLYQMELTLR
ncbi:GNAT family N-acetyltransferase [Pontibacter sp. G13]|uniref:GNAT family N-acetyltransferase n=1 Tax=Pontibacter sp. G13 TaxID=3074898 RepID=UPI00288C0E85|nr:GNAT family N-acetyltransferase [Pontibacter sp. G13]WNJ17092.1 GNAT family N-acetyltransferase [Pontibacter sp. G13]